MSTLSPWVHLDIFLSSTFPSAPKSSVEQAGYPQEVQRVMSFAENKLDNNDFANVQVLSILSKVIAVSHLIILSDTVQLLFVCM